MYLLKGKIILDKYKKSLYIQQVKTIYEQTISGAMGNLLSVFLIAYIFYGIVETYILVILVLLISVVSALRVFIYKAFLKRKDDDSISFWGNSFIALSTLSALIWSFSWTMLIPTDSDIHLAIIGMWIMGLMSSGLFAYSVYLKAGFLSATPIVLSGIVLLFSIGGTYATSIAMALIIYTTFILRVTIPINRSIVNSIVFNLKLEDEIIERKNIEKRLLELSIKDELTGLFNRRYFNEQVKSEISLAKRASLKLSFIMIDIDNFKSYNDSYGHLEGDNCIKRVAGAIKNSAKRDSDSTYRYGGEELSVLLPNTNQEDALEIAEQIRKSVLALNIEHSRVDLDGMNVLSISLGVATISPDKCTTPVDLISKADKALYIAKDKGKNRVEFYT